MRIKTVYHKWQKSLIDIFRVFERPHALIDIFQGIYIRRTAEDIHELQIFVRSGKTEVGSDGELPTKDNLMNDNDLEQEENKGLAPYLLHHLFQKPPENPIVRQELT